MNVCSLCCTTKHTSINDVYHMLLLTQLVVNVFFRGLTSLRQHYNSKIVNSFGTNWFVTKGVDQGTINVRGKILATCVFTAQDEERHCSVYFLGSIVCTVWWRVPHLRPYCANLSGADLVTFGFSWWTVRPQVTQQAVFIWTNMWPSLWNPG